METAGNGRKKTLPVGWRITKTSSRRLSEAFLNSQRNVIFIIPPVAGGNIEAWGELTYAKPLTEKQMADYELKPSPDNPDQPRRSITARLKEASARQEADIRSQKPHYKNQEER